ncbi:MAG: potassium/proton antiporter [Rubripirellula sp.]
MLPVESLVLISGVLLFAGVVASKLSDWVGVPALLIFLAIGMIAGEEGLGQIAFDSPHVAQAVGSICLLVILFAGGLDTKWTSVRSVLAPGLLLSTVGVLLTTLLLGAFAWFALGTYSTFDIGLGGLTWTEALLLAAIVSSTDAAAVFSVFRTSDVKPRSGIRYLLEFESGSNDPMAVLLTTAILSVMTSGNASLLGVVGGLFVQLLAGTIIGCGIGFAGSWLVNRLQLSASGLHPILVLSIGLMSFGFAELAGGNGFLAIYVCGVVLGNRLVRHREFVLRFHDGLSWLSQLGMFIVLGLLVVPSRLVAVAGVAIAMALFLMFVARPISVITCLTPFGMQRKEIAYISWVGLRGSVPIVLATFPVSYGIERADEVFNVIFFIVLTSVLIQGMTLVPCARWFGVVEDADKSES